MRYVFTCCLLISFLSLGRLFAQDSTVTVIEPASKHPVTSMLTPDRYPGKQAIVGSGGGFTGQTMTYYLLENGNLFSKNGLAKTYAYVGKQTPENTKRVFSVLENNCAIRKTTFSQPGNLYKFVGWRRGSEKHTVTWGAARKPVPENYPRFYDAFMAMLPKKN